MSGILIASPRRRQLAQEDGNRILYGLQTQKSSRYSSSRDVAVAIVASTSAFTHPTGPPWPEPAPASPALGWISLQPDLKIKALISIVFFPYFLAEKVLGWCQWFKAGVTPAPQSLPGILQMENGIMAGQILHPGDVTAVLQTCTEALLSPSSPTAFTNPWNLLSASSLLHAGLHQRWGSYAAWAGGCGSRK